MALVSLFPHLKGLLASLLVVGTALARLFELRLRLLALVLTECFPLGFVLGFDHFGFGFALDSRFVMSSSVGPLARIGLGSSLVRFG